MSKFKFTLLSFILIAAFILSACASPAQAPAGGESGSADLGGETLVVAHDVNFPPFEFLQNDNYTGFDLDLMNAIAETANFEPDYRAMDFNGIIPALQANQVDMAIAAMTIKPDREEVVDFSTPYFRTGLVLAVKPDNNEIVNPEDLKGKSIAVKIGTSGDAFIRALPYADEIQIDTYDSNNDTYLAVINGNDDATINDDSTLRFYIAQEGEGNLKIVGDLLTGDNYGIAVPKGNEQTLNAVNAAIAQLVENGTYDQIYEKWFGEKPQTRPGEF